MYYSFKQPAKKIFKNLWKLILKPHIFMFLVIFFLCGAVWGFLESYLFWFLEDLGSTKLTMGVSLAVGSPASTSFPIMPPMSTITYIGLPCLTTS